MKCVRKLACIMLFGAVFGASVASATVIYSEDFQLAGFQGASLGLPSSELFSERYLTTDYYNINDFNSWDFSGSTYLAVGSTGDAGVLLNETTGSALTVVGLTSGQDYVLTFNHSGDNRPNLEYEIALTIDGNPFVLTSPRSWSTTGPGILETILFTASSDSINLLFGETSATEASPIIDNILIETALNGSAPVPEPSTFILLGAGLAGLAVWRKKRS